eukprot:jgi/Ulvmu1/1712/UM116_0025.1
MRRFAAAHNGCTQTYLYRPPFGPSTQFGMVQRRSTTAFASTLIIVESPTKAKKIAGYLGESYTVAPSYGHVRQLPPQPGAVDPQRQFEMDWQVPPQKQKIVDYLFRCAQKSKRVLLASDPDREGEAIAWHLAQIFQGKLSSRVSVQRITFSEITPSAIERALEAPRPVDHRLVEAYLARICADYLLGFSVSPMLWRKLPGARSAGRVQSVALRLVCDQEFQRDIHKSVKYFTASVQLDGKPRCHQVSVSVVVDGKTKFDQNPASGDGLISTLQGADYAIVQDISHGSRSQKAPRPYTTARLQQDASRLLGFTPKQTMAIAQSLFEDGLITYHRTDGEAIADERQQAIRTVVQEAHPQALPQQPVKYQTKVKNAQEAHDAITVTNPAVSAQDAIKNGGKRRWLYELIWRCTLACQMNEAQFETVHVKLQAGGVEMRTNARSLTVAGHLSVWQAASDIRRSDAESADGDPINPNEDAACGDGAGTNVAVEEQQKQYETLHSWKVGEKVRIVGVESHEHDTQPPGRYSEASLVKHMEQLGIGRPSTYARTIEVLQDRGYVVRAKRALVPTSKGQMLAAFLHRFFSKWVDFQFTAGMEEQLDDIGAGAAELQPFLLGFWTQLEQSLQEVDDVTVQQVFEELGNLLEYKLFPAREDGSDPRTCPACGTGRLFLLGTAQGGFVACSNYSEQRVGQRCQFKRTFTGEESATDAVSIGLHPKHNQMIFLLDGKYGKYLQVCVDGKNINCALPDTIKPQQMTLEQAIDLLSGPSVLGQHPETGMDITLRTGRFGPYYQHGTLQASTGKMTGEEPTLETAILKLELKAKRFGMTQAEAAAQKPSKRPNKSPVGALAHHAWVRQWREETGGNLAAGREAWKMLDTKKKWQFKIDFAEQCMSQANPGGQARPGNGQGSSIDAARTEETRSQGPNSTIACSTRNTQGTDQVESKSKISTTRRNRKEIVAAPGRMRKAKSRPMKRA